MSALSRLFAFLGWGQERITSAPALPEVQPAPVPAVYHPAQVAPVSAGIPVEAVGDLMIPPLPPVLPLVTADDIRALFPKAANPEGWAAAIDAACRRHGITTKTRLAAFLAQVGHESGGLTRLVENLNYSAKRLTEVWPIRYPTLAAAAPYANNPQALANHTYGGRNGNTQPNDGWYFRGRGLIQLTGRANYTRCAKALGILITDLPAYLETQAGAAEASAWWWEDAGCNVLADAGDFEALTRRINGGVTGLDDRRVLLAQARAALA